MKAILRGSSARGGDASERTRCADDMELEPRRTLIATQPFAKPKVGEQPYDTKIELEMQGENKRGYYRFYRRGVFVGYDIPIPAYTTSA
jgi:hypothetical protein